MSEQQRDIPMSKKGQREVSPFIGHELLYDYLSGSLDQERKKAVEDHVKFSRDAQLDLTKIQNGQAYAERLAETVVSQPILEQINSPTSYLTVLMQKSNFEKWPVGLKWGLEALVVVSVIVVVMTAVPWEKIKKLSESSNREIVLAEITKKPDSASGEKENDEIAIKYADEGTPDGPAQPLPSVAANGGKVVAAPVASPAVAPTSGSTNKPTTPSATPSTNAAPTASIAVSTPVTVTAKAPSVPPVAPTEPTATKVADAETPRSSVSGGFLYRGSVVITNIAMVGPKIKDKIMELGGRKAGDVELGWQKTENSQYFHFTIPEAKYNELNAFLSEYGKPRIGKEKHPRVMPDGIIRLILTVDEAKN